MEKEERKCKRMYGCRKENWDHVWRDTDWGSIGTWQEMVGEVLEGEGMGKKWMKKLEELRRGKGGGGRGWFGPVVEVERRE